MSVHAVVIAREMWDTRDLVGPVLDTGGGLKAGAVSTRFEPQDLNALEAALRIKESVGGEVTALSFNAIGDVDVLKECLYRGADQAIRIGADSTKLDTAASATLAAEAIRKLGDVNLVLVGWTAAEGESSVLGSHLAGLLGMEQISFVDRIMEAGDDFVIGRRAIEMGEEDIRVSLPALLSLGVALVEDDPRAPRPAKAMLKLKHKKTEIPVWNPADLGVPDPAANTTTVVATMESVPERVIESTVVDAEDESGLKAMLDRVLKGE